MKKIFIVFFFVFLVGGVVAYAFRGDIREVRLEAMKSDLPKPVSYLLSSQDTPFTSGDTVVKAVDEINLDVPFSSQAPTKNWGMPYQEACEEASMILVDAFYRRQILSPAEMDSAIQKLVKYEERRFGFYQHTTATDTAQILRDYFGYPHVEVVYDFSLEDLKKELREGHPVIVPLAGQKVGNPFYTAKGPVYHMLVVRGFTKDGRIITNDVGTQHGENYPFDEKVFFDAIHDVPTSGATWSTTRPEEFILMGRKAMVVVYPAVPS